MIVGMNHFTVIAEDAQKTLDFYVGLLGLRVGPRPAANRGRTRPAAAQGTRGIVAAPGLPRRHAPAIEWGLRIPLRNDPHGGRPAVRLS